MVNLDIHVCINRNKRNTNLDQVLGLAVSFLIYSDQLVSNEIRQLGKQK